MPYALNEEVDLRKERQEAALLLSHVINSHLPELWIAAEPRAVRAEPSAVRASVEPQLVLHRPIHAIPIRLRIPTPVIRLKSGHQLRHRDI